MTDKWISKEDRLPDQREFIESYVRSAYAAESWLRSREQRKRQRCIISKRVLDRRTV